MTTTTIVSKTGQMNMGGYFREKTAEVFRVDFPEIGEVGKYFRFRYLGDSADQCFETMEEAMDVFSNAVKCII